MMTRRWAADYDDDNNSNDSAGGMAIVLRLGLFYMSKNEMILLLGQLCSQMQVCVRLL